MTPLAKAQTVKTLVHSVGFELVGITTVDPLPGGAYYRDWLAAGYAAALTSLRRTVRIRATPAALLAGARSVICVALGYRRADGYCRPPSRGHASAPGTPYTGLPAGVPAGRVAQYARGRDYHSVLHLMLAALRERLHAALPEPFETAEFVDTGPLLERELAARAGLGWIGRNTCLLHPQRGSYLLLGEMLTTLELAPDTPLAERCGTCTRCIDSCPTRALVPGACDERGRPVSPAHLNAARCISYLTIEHAGEIAPDLRPAMGDWVFGCDLCQQVCPYNARAPRGAHPDLMVDHLAAAIQRITPPPAGDAGPSAATSAPAPDADGRIPLRPLLQLSNGDHRRLTRDSARRRARRDMWRRNAAVALANQAFPPGTPPQPPTPAGRQ
jgi:epoxyqueuosine reductase